MGCGIYKITNVNNDKVYIGSSVDVSKRKYKHFWMLRKGIHDNNHLQNSFNKEGEKSFLFEVLEYCGSEFLVERENHYISKYKSVENDNGYNMATVNDFRRNTYNEEVKLKISKYNLKKNGNFTKFYLINIKTDEKFTFESLVDGANYLINNGFSKGRPSNVRQKLSYALRGVKVNNGSMGSIRKTCYGHKFKIIE